jgi:hypothetical protein
MTEAEAASACIAVVDYLCRLLAPANLAVEESETGGAVFERTRSSDPDLFPLDVPHPEARPSSPREHPPRARSLVILE